MDEEQLTKRQRQELRRQERRKDKEQGRQKSMIGRSLFTAAAVLALVGGGIYLAREFLKPLPGVSTVSEGQGHIEMGQEHTPYKTNPPTSGPHYTQQVNWGIHKAFISNEYQVHNLEHGGVIVHYRCPPQIQTSGFATPSAKLDPSVLSSGLKDLVQHGEKSITEATLSASTKSASQATPSAQPDQGCLELEATLAQVVSRYPAKVILMPNPTIGTRIALTAWTRIDQFDALDTDRVKRFIDSWINRGPEKVPDNMSSVYFP